MTTLGLKIRWSESAFSNITRLLILPLLLFLAAACSHSPDGRHAAGGKNRAKSEVRGWEGIRFSVHAPDADNVLFIIMRTHAPKPEVHEVQARKGPDGMWTADLDLIPGEYRYFFIVDGSVTVDKDHGRFEQDDFGSVTGVLTVRRTPEGKLKTF